MRYSEMDLQIEDLMWFAIDRAGYIGAFTSGGCANVPEFICRSREDNERLYDYIMDELDDFASGKLIGIKQHSEQGEDCSLLISKGITCFDVFKHGDDYGKIAESFEPITIDQLDDEIKDILQDHKIDADFLNDDIIKVEHAY